MWVAKDFRSVIDLGAYFEIAYAGSNLFHDPGNVIP